MNKLEDVAANVVTKSPGNDEFGETTNVSDVDYESPISQGRA